MAALHVRKSNGQLTQNDKSFLLQLYWYLGQQSYQICKKTDFLCIQSKVKKIIETQTSTTYLSNRTTGIIFFLVQMEKLPVLDIQMAQVSCLVHTELRDDQLQQTHSTSKFTLLTAVSLQHLGAVPMPNQAELVTSDLIVHNYVFCPGLNTFSQEKTPMFILINSNQ